MFNFIKKQKSLKEAASEKDEILTALEEVSTKLEAVENMFSNYLDSDLIDSCIFEYKALQTRYQYLIKLARERALSVPVRLASSADMPEAKNKTAAV